MAYSDNKKAPNDKTADTRPTAAGSGNAPNAATKKITPPSNARKKAASSAAKKNRKSPAAKEQALTGWRQRLGGLTNSALSIARKTTGGSIKVGRTILNNQEQLKVMVAAGESLKDLREVAGLTISEMSDAINLKDKSLLEAVEDGTSTLSFELILRLAALLARNDPIPFVIKYTRTYNPDVWRILDDWGLGRIPLHYERERKFINIYRRHDAARRLSDDGFDKVLAFTSNAFEMALHFIAENEDININIKEKSPDTDIKESFAHYEEIKANENKTNPSDSIDQWRKKKPNSAPGK